MQAVSVLLGVALAAAHLLWIFERHHNPEMFPKTYLAGIWESLWWSLVTATTVGYGDKSPVSFVGRLVAIVWMFTGLFVVAYFTAAITADRLESNISDLTDLVGKQVATVADTTSARYMKNQQPVKVNLSEFYHVEDAYKALKAGQVQALVYDSPTLLYQTSQNREYQIVGELFAEQDYGIVLPQGSHYREPINRIILQLQEDGELTNLEQKWFPSNQ